MKWQLEMILSGISHLTDGGMTLRFTSIKDLDEADKLALIHSHNRTGWLAFKEDEWQEGDIPKEQTEPGGKSPAQRLRNTLYVYWQQTNKGGDFETFYRTQMERLINKVKGHLDD